MFFVVKFEQQDSQHQKYEDKSRDSIELKKCIVADKDDDDDDE